MRMLGLIMLTVGVVLAPCSYYIIDVGRFPANLTITVAVWVIVAIIGLFLFLANPPRKR
jgi:uncharacterized membrane protein (GlpM family)